MPHFASLFNFACWLTQDRASAEDLVQETFMKALKGFGSYRQGSNFRAWIYRILRNTFLTSRTGLKAAAEVSLDSADEVLTRKRARRRPSRCCWRKPAGRPSSAPWRRCRCISASRYCFATWRR